MIGTKETTRIASFLIEPKVDGRYLTLQTLVEEAFHPMELEEVYVYVPGVSLALLRSENHVLLMPKSKCFNIFIWSQP